MEGLLMEKVIRGMEAGGFEVVPLRTAKEACQYLLAHIPRDAVVGAGGSVSVRDTNVLEELRARGNKVLSATGAPPQEQRAIRRAAMEADVYLTSANAITKQGQLVLVDGLANRVGAVAYGPKTVFFVVSHSKVVDGGINTAIARIKKVACPQNARRLGLTTSCAATGLCGGSTCADSMCRVTLVLDRVPREREMRVLLVEEALGY